MVDLLKFSIPGKPKYVQMIRLAIGSISSQFGFDVGKVEDMTVAVSEACKLVTCHGQEKFSEFYDVIVEISENSISITVSDFCTEGRVDKNVTQCMQCPEDGNLSHFVIETLMDEVEITQNEKGNKSIKMVKIK